MTTEISARDREMAQRIWANLKHPQPISPDLLRSELLIIAQAIADARVADLRELSGVPDQYEAAVETQQTEENAASVIDLFADLGLDNEAAINVLIRALGRTIADATNAHQLGLMVIMALTNTILINAKNGADDAG
jgi:hypothetical protein